MVINDEGRDDNKILLSIIVPVYNVEKYIDECLMSIVKQNVENIEVILINDGSTDNSRMICEEYCQNHSYMTLYNQENQGLSMARNQGMAFASGKYILFLDSDDYLVRNTLKELIELLSDSEADVIVGKYDRYNEQTLQYKATVVENLEKYKNLDSLDLYISLTKTNLYWFQVAVAIVKREFIIDNQLSFKRGIYCEDELWALKLFLSDPKVSLFDKSYFCYREARKGSITSNRNIKKEFDKIIIMNEFAKNVDEINDKKKIRILKARMAFLEWSIIQELEYYADCPGVNELKEMLTLKINYLNYGKSVWKYLLCRAVGIEDACKFNLKISRWCNFFTRQRV